MGGKCQALAWGALLLATIWTRPASAAPRDAIRNLPRLSHSSSFESTSSDNTSQELYNGVWRIDWLAADIRLGSASLRPSLAYSTTVSENRDHRSGTDASGRQDWVNFKLDLKARQRIGGYFLFDQADATSSRAPGSGLATSHTGQTKEAYLQWAGPPGTTLYGRHNAASSYDYLGEQQTSASEVQSSSFGAQFDARPRDALQSYRAQTDLVQREVYLPLRSSSSQRKTVVSGIRSLPLGKIGMMTLDYNFLEQSSTLPGFTRAQTNSQTQYGLSLFGRVDKLPLDYSYNFHNSLSSYEQQPGERNTSSDLQLTYVMPAPAGRSSSINAHYSLQDYAGAAVSSSSATQSLRWSFAASPRLRGNVVFQHDDSGGAASVSPSTQKDSLTADLQYDLSHGRGSLSANYQQVNQSDTSNNRNTTSTARVAAGFALGKQSRFQVFLDELDSESQLGAFGETHSTSNLGQGFNYSYRSPVGLALVANWRQTLTETHPSDARNTNSQLNLQLDYDSPAGWRYELNLAANDMTRDSPFGGERSYSTEDRIQARISYSF
jgi:hypothetical protein